METVFSWPGLGLATYDALKGPDYPMLQGLFLLFSAAVIVTNLLADLLYGYLDPRVSDGVSTAALSSPRRIAWRAAPARRGGGVARVPPQHARDGRAGHPRAGRR